MTLTDGSAFLFDTRVTTELAVEEMLKNKVNASKNVSVDFIILIWTI